MEVVLRHETFWMLVVRSKRFFVIFLLTNKINLLINKVFSLQVIFRFTSSAPCRINGHLSEQTMNHDAL